MIRDLLYNRYRLIQFSGPAIIFMVALIVGTVLRLYKLGYPYEYDEILDLQIARHFANISELLTYLNTTQHNPLGYYLPLHYWIQLFGYSPLATRSLSAAFGIGLIVLTYIIGQRIFPRTSIGAIAALFVAILPIQVMYSGNALPYIIFCTISLVAAYTLWQYLQARRWTYLLSYTVLAAIGIWVHISFFFILTAMYSYWLVIIVQHRRDENGHRVVPLIISLAGVAVATSPLLETIIFNLIINSYGIEGLGGGTWQLFSFGKPLSYIEQTLTLLIWRPPRGGENLDPLTVALIFFVKVALLYYVGHLILKVRETKSLPYRFLDTIIAYLLWLTLVPIVVFMFSPQASSYSDLTERHIIFSSVFMCYLIALLVCKLNSHRAALTLSVIIATILPFTLSLYVPPSHLFDNQQIFYQQYPQISSRIINNYSTNDVVLVRDGHWRSVLDYTLPPYIPIISLFPVQYLENETLLRNSPIVPTFLEFQAIWHHRSMTNKEVLRKIQLVTRATNARRLWVVLNNPRDMTTIRQMFETLEWRYSPGHGTIPGFIDMYEKQDKIDTISNGASTKESL